MKRFLPVFLALVLLLIPLAALGSTNNISTGKLVQPLTYQTLSGGSSQLSDNGNGKITISGYTSTYYPVSQIGVTLNLQYLSNGNWNTLESYNLGSR